MKILSEYGNLVNMGIKLKIGKKERIIPYLVRVKQGDNMAPVLFLFTMQAMAEASPLEKEWSKNGIDIPQF